MDEELRAFDATEQAAGRKLADAWQTFSQAKGAEAIERGEEIEQTARIAEVQYEHEGELLRMQNVVGVAASLKVVKGKPTGKYALTVYVEKKQPLTKLTKDSRVPDELDGVVTDVVEIGRPEALVFNARVRPALPGFSVGHHNITAGTYGCMVQDVRSGDYLMLSNNHVFAATNRGQIGDLILQPGPFDGGVFPADGIATLDRFEPIVFGATGYNLVDAAVAKPTFSRNITSSIIGVRMPSGINQALLGNVVIKAGRTTQVTVGVVIAVNATVAVGYGAAGVAQFRHQIFTTAMAAGGDSGSLLMNAGLQAVGLLFAGSAIITIHNHIADVEAALGVRPLTAPR
jgi:hypothetical protein